MDNHTPDIPLRRCSKCKRELPATAEYFHRQSSLKSGLKYACKQCNGRPFSLPDLSVPEAHKRCSRCEEVFPATTEYFHRHSTAKYGVTSKCKSCAQQYKRDNAEHIRKRQKEYNTANAEHIRETTARYYLANAEHLRERNRNYQRSHSEQKKKYRAANIDRDREHGARYRREHPESYRASRQRRLARQRELSDTFTVDDYKRMMDYWNHCCAYCGVQRDFWYTIQTDHFVPLTSPSCPGTITANMIPACKSCNSSKCDNDPIKWLNNKFGNRKTAHILARISAYFEWVSVL